VAGAVNRLGVGNKPLDLIGNPSRLRQKVISIFAVHAASQKGLVTSHKICNRLLEAAWYRGSSGLLKAEWAGSGNRAVGPDPDGCLVQRITDTETCEVPAMQDADGHASKTAQGSVYAIDKCLLMGAS
jgi:hypothetical protein